MNRFLDALSRLQQRHALLLFLALGAALFTVDGLRRAPLPLTPPEVAGEGATAAQWLEDEVLYREALTLGLDDGDLIVRRRLVQKMRQLLETGVDVAEPSEADLRAWIDAHAGRYGGMARISLDHVFLSRSLRTGSLAEVVEQIGTQLRSGAVTDLTTLSDPHPAGTQLTQRSARELESLFGTALIAPLGELPLDRWEGPLPSALGFHFVRIRERQTQTPDYVGMRERAQRDYLVEHRREGTRLALDALKARYGLSAATATP